MLYATSSKSPPLRGSLRFEDFSFEPSSSSNRSPQISVDSYTALISFMFIMCNVTQCGQLWIVADFSACNTNKSAPLITTITTSRLCKSCNHEDLAHNRLPPCLQPNQKYKQTPPPPKKRTFQAVELGRLSKLFELSDSEFWFLFCLDSNLIHSEDSCNSCNLKTIMKLFFLSVVFSDLGFSRKILCLIFFFIVLYLRALSDFISRLWWGSTVQSLVAKNHHRSCLG